MGRVAFRADKRLQERLENVVEAMEKKKSLKHFDVTMSTAVKVALAYGLPFLELEFGSKTFGDGEETPESWIKSVYSALAFWADLLDLTVDTLGEHPNPDVGDPDELSK